MDIFDCEKLFSAGIELCHPTSYDIHPKQFGRDMRKYRKLVTHGGRIIPWVAPGGSNSLRMVAKKDHQIHYDYLLEGYGSGVSGFYWFSFFAFQGMDYYLHGKAMEAINPIAVQIYEGVPVEGVRSDRTEVSATALSVPDGAVILVSDYTSAAPGGAISITFPDNILLSGQVWEMSTQTLGGSIRGNRVTIPQWRPGVPGAHTALYFVGSLNAQSTPLTRARTEAGAAR
jgi:hypothetical protein